MKKEINVPVHLSSNFNVKSVAAVKELAHNDMIYIYHHLQIGSIVNLIAEGTNLKGDIRYKVLFKNFTLGYVSLGGYFRAYYESNPELDARIISMQKNKFMPVKELDIEVDMIRLKNVS